jgi:hypothetical protein
MIMFSLRLSVSAVQELSFLGNRTRSSSEIPRLRIQLPVHRLRHFEQLPLGQIAR